MQKEECKRRSASLTPLFPYTLVAVRHKQACKRTRQQNGLCHDRAQIPDGPRPGITCERHRSATRHAVLTGVLPRRKNRRQKDRRKSREAKEEREERERGRSENPNLRLRSRLEPCHERDHSSKRDRSLRLGFSLEAREEREEREKGRRPR